MSNFNPYFTLYENTDPPPIITDEYKKVYYQYHPKQDLIPKTKDKKSTSDNSTDKDSITWVYSTQTEVPKRFPWKEQLKKRPNNQIISYFMDKGLTENQARGIYGNLMQESQLNPFAVSSDGHNSYGIAQWTGSRKKQLFLQYGPSPSLQQQLDYLWHELNTTEKGALQALKSTTNVHDATKVFMEKFERPHKDYANFNNRLKYANTQIQYK